MTRRAWEPVRDASLTESDLSLYQMADDTILPIPNLTLPQHLFVLSNPAFESKHPDARTNLLDGIRADRAYPLPLHYVDAQIAL